MILLIKHRVDWELIRWQKQTQIYRDNSRKNKHRVDYGYKVRDKVILTNHTAYKYETPYKFTFVIIQCFTNGTVMFQYGPTKIRHNIHHIKPYKSDTKVEYFISKICLMTSAYKRQLYIFVLNIKAWNKIYNWMSTEAFDCNVILAVQ